MTTIRRFVAYGAVAATTLGGILVATPAQAGATSTIDIPSGEVHFVAGDGQANQVVVTKLVGPAHTYRFDDVHTIVFNDVYPVSAGACTYPYPADTTVMDCDHAATIINVKTGDLDDYIDYRPALSWQLEAGDGNDTVRTGDGPGSPGRYTAAGPGDDTIVSGPGTEYISGGTGTDTVSYVGRWTAVTATVTSGGGSAGETDAYDGIENITGGGGADTLVGNGSPNVLDGGYAMTPCWPHPMRAEVAEMLAVPAAPRTDAGAAGKGADVTTDAAAMSPAVTTNALPPCTSYSGNDNLSGGDSADLLFGRGGDDVLAGGAGYDTLDGGSGIGDWCYIDAGGGTKVNCEFPLIINPPF